MEDISFSPCIRNDNLNNYAAVQAIIIIIPTGDPIKQMREWLHEGLGKVLDSLKEVVFR